MPAPTTAILSGAIVILTCRSIQMGGRSPGTSCPGLCSRLLAMTDLLNYCAC
jgi:hypothetical protein